jgi:hypothetical protein
MMRLAWIGTLALAAGCGSAVTSGWTLPETGTGVGGGPSASAHPAEIGEAASLVAEPAAVMAISARGIGYFAVGYDVAAVGSHGLDLAGSGSGFSLGAGFKFGESPRHFLEVSTARTLMHDVPTQLTGGARTTGYYQRWLFGARSAATPQARMENQPRAYLTYGLSSNTFRVKYSAGSEYLANGVGFYLGLGAEFPTSKKASVAFDTKYMYWEDGDAPNPGEFAELVYSLVWMSRF